MNEWQGEKWQGATWHPDHKLGVMCVENATWPNAWHPCATWEGGMDVKVIHGNHVSLKWRMKKKKEREFYQIEECDQFIEEEKNGRKMKERKENEIKERKERKEKEERKEKKERKESGKSSRRI